MFSIYDTKGNFFMSPFVCENEQVAMRHMSSTMMDDAHPMTQHAEDYTLYEIAEFDSDSGEVAGFPPKAVVNLSTLRNAVMSQRMQWASAELVEASEPDKVDIVRKIYDA